MEIGIENEDRGNGDAKNKNRIRRGRTGGDGLVRR